MNLITLNKEYSLLLKDTVTEYLNPNYIYLPVNDDKLLINPKDYIYKGKEILKNKAEIPQIKLYFTTDLRQNQETLENTLIEFKIDEATKKYKMYNVEAKILGI